MADRYAVAVLKQGTAIGHLPRKISKVCSLFLRRRGSIRCTVTGSRRHPSDLPLRHYCAYVPVLNIRRKIFHCKIIFALKIFIHFLCMKTFLQRKEANYGIL